MRDEFYLDFNFFMMDYRCPGCRIHEGFHNMYDDIANNLLACVYTIYSNHPTAQVFVTGSRCAPPLFA